MLLDEACHVLKLPSHQTILFASMQHYDLIGDIHGHADELVKLLEHLGYSHSATGYQHETRKIIFLGDFIDRGEHLRQHREVLDVVRTMIDNDHALAVMGNHEFNALAYHTIHEGKYLRPHSEKNAHQHRAFLNEFGDDSDSMQSALLFFYSLPLWLELDGIRVIHACWDDRHIEVMKHLTADQRLDRDLLVEASKPGTTAHKAIETLLKGVEVKLPAGISFNDKDGHPRHAVRIRWWDDKALRLGDVAMPLALDIGEAAELPIPIHAPAYAPDAPPCFIGHYWLDGTPAPLAPNVACVDYSVAKGGKLVAYRWSGEREIQTENFTYV